MMLLLLNRLGISARATLALLIVSALSIAATGYKYFTRERPVVSLAPEHASNLSGAAVELKRVHDHERVARAVDHAIAAAPFSRLRGRESWAPNVDSLTYGRGDPPAEEMQPGFSVDQSVLVRGIASAHGGSGMAALQSGGGPVRIVRVGEAFLNFRLLSVSGDEVRLQGPDSIIIARYVSPDL